MAAIDDLDHDAQRLKVTRRKAREFLSSYAAEFLRMKKVLDSGGYEWDFQCWLLRKCGLFHDQAVGELLIMAKLVGVLTSDDRETVEEEARRLKAAERTKAAPNTAKHRTVLVSHDLGT